MKPINNLPKLTAHSLDMTEYTSIRAAQLAPLHVHPVPGREIVRIAGNGFVFSNPLSKPLLCPVQVRIQRFFAPISNYYGKMYDDDPTFDRNMKFHTVNLSTAFLGGVRANPSSLFWRLQYGALSPAIYGSVNLNRILAFLDIVRTFYAYSNQDIVCFAHCFNTNGPAPNQVEYFYPRVSTFYKFFKNLRCQDEGVEINKATVDTLLPGISESERNFILSMLSDAGFFGKLYLANPGGTSSVYSGVFPVLPSAPDALNRFYRDSVSQNVLAPVDSYAVLEGDGVAIPSITRGIKLQNLQDLINAGKKTFTSYMRTFFGRAVERKNRPVLLDTFQFEYNSSMVNSTQGSSVTEGLGQFVGVGQASLTLPRKRYHFDSFGYLFDLISIRPIHAWTGIAAEDTLDTNFNQTFNEKLNEIGFVYKNLTGTNQGSAGWVPCWNQYRTGYDVVSGQMASFDWYGQDYVGAQESSWKSFSSADGLYVYVNKYQTRGGNLEPDDATSGLKEPLAQLFMSVESANVFFAAPLQENFFVRMSYSIRTLNLVGHRFANSARV